VDLSYDNDWVLAKDKTWEQWVQFYNNILYKRYINFYRTVVMRSGSIDAFQSYLFESHKEFEHKIEETAFHKWVIVRAIRTYNNKELGYSTMSNSKEGMIHKTVDGNYIPLIDQDLNWFHKRNTVNYDKDADVTIEDLESIVSVLNITDKQKDILKAALHVKAEGYSKNEIGEMLNVSPSTISKLFAILKLECVNREILREPIALTYPDIDLEETYVFRKMTKQKNNCIEVELTGEQIFVVCNKIWKKETSRVSAVNIVWLFIHGEKRLDIAKQLGFDVSKIDTTIRFVSQELRSW